MPELLPKDPKQRRKLLIYAGLAGALLLIVVLSRRGSADATTQPEQPLTAVGSPIPADAGIASSGGSTVDNGGQLAAFESALLDQLPSAVESGVAAGLANGVAPPDPAPAGAGTTIINLGAGPTAGGSAAPAVKPIPHPAAAAAAKLFAGHPLAWWQNPANAKQGGKWKWPGTGYVHSRAYEGH